MVAAGVLAPGQDDATYAHGARGAVDRLWEVGISPNREGLRHRDHPAVDRAVVARPQLVDHPAWGEFRPDPRASDESVTLRASFSCRRRYYGLEWAWDKD
jgi:hypothetical protein